MSNTITLTLDQFTQAQSLNTVVSGLERMLALLGQVDKYKDLLNKAAGKPQDIVRITAELAKIEKQIIAIQVAEEKLLRQREKTNQEASKSALAQQRLEDQKQKAAERYAAAKAKAEAAAQAATEKAAQAKAKAEEAAARAAARATAEAQRLSEQQRKAAEAAKRDAERAAAAAQRLADQQNRAAEQQRRAAESAARAEEKKRRELAAQTGIIGRLQDNVRRLNQLQRQATTPEQIERVNRMLEQQRNRLRELQQAGRQTTNTLGNAVNSFQFKFNFLGNLLAEGLSNSLGALKAFGAEAIQLSLQSEGIKTAFGRLNDPNLLDELRTATQGTVSDLELMRSAVKAANFKLPLNQLATYLKFAQQRALETGESVDYLVESIVTGISRKSIPIMDNLGISATEIQAEFKKTGDFAEAAGNIIDREMAKAGGSIDNNATKVQRLQATWENLKLSIGDFLVEGGAALVQFFDLVSGKISYAELKLKNFGDAMFEAGKERGAEFIKIIEQTAKTVEQKTKAVGILNEQLNKQKTSLDALNKAGKISNEDYLYRTKIIKGAILTLNNYNKALNEPPPKDSSTEERIAADYTEIENRIRLIQDARAQELAEAELSKQKELTIAAEKGYDKNKILEYYRIKAVEINAKYDEKEITDLITQGEKEQDQYIANKEQLAVEKQKQFEEDRKRSQMIVDLQKEEDEIIAQMQQENVDREKRLMEERIEMTDQIVSNAIDGVSKRRDAEISAIEDQVSAQRDAVAQQRELANQGAANSLAAEEQRLAELERKKVEAQRRNERLQKVETYYNLLSSYAKDDPQTAPQKALVQMAIAEGIAAAFLEKGGMAGDATDTTTISNLGLSKSHKDGNVLAVLSPNEGVLSAKQVQALGGEAGFYSLQRMLDNPHNDDFTRQAEPFTHIVSAPRVDIAPVVQELKAVKDAIRKIPGNNFAVDEFGNLIHTIVQDGKREVINKGKFVSPNRKRFL